MYKTGLTFDCIELNNHAKDLMLEAKLWDDNSEPMASLVVTNWAHIGRKARRNHRGRTGSSEKSALEARQMEIPQGFLTQWKEDQIIRAILCSFRPVPI